MAGEAFVAVIGALLAMVVAAAYTNTRGWLLVGVGVLGALVAAGMLDGWRGHS